MNFYSINKNISRLWVVSFFLAGCATDAASNSVITLKTPGILQSIILPNSLYNRVMSNKNTDMQGKLTNIMFGMWASGVLRIHWSQLPLGIGSLYQKIESRIKKINDSVVEKIGDLLHLPKGSFLTGVKTEIGSLMPLLQMIAIRELKNLIA